MPTLLAQIDPKTFLFDSTLFAFIALIIGVFVYRSHHKVTPPLPSSVFKLNVSAYKKPDLLASTIVVGLFASLTVFLPYLWLYIEPYLPQLSATHTTPPEDVSENAKVFAMIVGLIIQFVFPSALLLILLGFRGKIVDILGLRNIHFGKVCLISILGVFSAFFFLTVLGVLGYEDLMKTIFGETEKQAAVKQLLEAESTAMKAVMIFAAVVVAPIFEEIIFRGCFYASVKRYTGPIFSIFISSLLFSLVHGSAPAAIPLFIVGAILAISYELSGSLWTSVIIHAVFNFLQVAGMLFLAANQ